MYLDLPSRHCIEFLKGTLGLKRSAPNWAVLRECAHKPLQFYWLRAAIWFYWLLSSNSATIKQALHVDLKLVPRAKTSWASDIMRDLRDCEAAALIHKLSCRGSLFVTQISLLTLSSSHQLRKRGHLGRKAPSPEKKRGGSVRIRRVAGRQASRPLLIGPPKLLVFRQNLSS